MAKDTIKRPQTDSDAKRKAIKLVIMHLKKKVSREFLGSDYVGRWVSDMEELLQKTDFNIIECFEMRKRLNDVIESTLDEEIRFKLRDSWYSLGKALDKKVRQG